jgi:phosphoglycerate dehydrogenase-like enzyme
MPEPQQPLTIWCNAKFPPPVMDALRRGLTGHRFVEAARGSATNLDAGSADPQLEQADIAFGQPDPHQVAKLARLRYVQLTTAGYTRYDNETFRAAVTRHGTAVCNASSVYAEPCAQHLLAMMLALARRLPQSLDNQRGPRAWPYLPLRAASKLLNGQTVLLVGYGAIARRLTELLAPFRVNVLGFRRNPRGDEPGVRTLPIAELDAHLGEADHVVNILPASDETANFFDAARFARMNPSAVYYNIGRGTTNDEAALAAALRETRIAAAYVDAFETEPLPASHPLWTTPNCFVTPHTAGGHADEADRHVALFLDNLKRLQSGGEFVDRIM